MDSPRLREAHHMGKNELQASKIKVFSKRGKLVDKFHFSLSGVTIPSITEQPVKSLGKYSDRSLKDSVSIQETYIHVR